MADEEADCCPLCMEELDITDKTFNACPCDYQVCLWCWHQIKNEYNGLCPACRTPYAELSKHKNPLDREDVVRRTKQRKQKEKNERKTSSQSKHIAVNRKNLANVRVMQRNLVYVIGLPVHFADEELLRSIECFGQYGKIVKAVVNKSHLNSDRVNATASAYITFESKDDALGCILAIDGYYLDGSMLRASFGTTKYCNFFLRNLSCNNPDCLYLHALGDQDDSFTKEEMQSALHSGKASFRDPGLSDKTGESRSGSTFPPPARSTTDDNSEVATDNSKTDQEGTTGAVKGSQSSTSDAQRQAQSAAAIHKLKQAAIYQTDNTSTNTSLDYEDLTTSVANIKLATPNPHTSAFENSNNTIENSKPLLRVDTSSVGTTSSPIITDTETNKVTPLEQLKLVTRSESQEPAWAKPFPSPSAGNSLRSEIRARPNSTSHIGTNLDSLHIYSPFGMGFDTTDSRELNNMNVTNGVQSHKKTLRRTASASSTQFSDMASPWHTQARSPMLLKQDMLPSGSPSPRNTFASQSTHSSPIYGFTPVADNCMENELGVTSVPRIQHGQLERSLSTPSGAQNTTSLSFASVDAIFSQRNESSEAVAGLLGVQLSSVPMTHGVSASSPMQSAKHSRFAFANQPNSVSLGTPLPTAPSHTRTVNITSKHNSPALPHKQAPGLSPTLSAPHSQYFSGYPQANKSDFRTDIMHGGRQINTRFEAAKNLNYNHSLTEPINSLYSGNNTTHTNYEGLHRPHAYDFNEGIDKAPQLGLAQTTQPPMSESSGLAFLKQVLPNVNISLGREYPSLSGGALNSGNNNGRISVSNTASLSDGVTNQQNVWNNNTQSYVRSATQEYHGTSSLPQHPTELLNGRRLSAFEFQNSVGHKSNDHRSRVQIPSQPSSTGGMAFGGKTYQY